jgi:hypothetical protein
MTVTTLENRPNTALLVVDVQNTALERAHERDAVVANVGRLVEWVIRTSLDGWRRCLRAWSRTSAGPTSR